MGLLDKILPPGNGEYCKPVCEEPTKNNCDREEKKCDGEDNAEWGKQPPKWQEHSEKKCDRVEKCDGEENGEWGKQPPKWQEHAEKKCDGNGDDNDYYCKDPGKWCETDDNCDDSGGGPIEVLSTLPPADAIDYEICHMDAGTFDYADAGDFDAVA